MAASIGRALIKFGRNSSIDVLCQVRCAALPTCSSKFMSTSKHYDPKFRTKRREKYPLMDKQEMVTGQKSKRKVVGAVEEAASSEGDEDEDEPKHKERYPQRTNVKYWTKLDHYSGIVYDDYIPPEGDGKSSAFTDRSIEMFDQGKRALRQRLRDQRHIRKYEDNFTFKDIAPVLLNIYIDAMTLLPNYKKDEGRFFELVTPVAASEMTYNMERLTMKWEYLQSIEPPKVVNCLNIDGTRKGHYFTQLTLRIHSKQKLAIYDQFGRLMYGCPDHGKNVLEYVVYEKDITEIYGRWRVHGRVRPAWQTEADFSTHRTVFLGRETADAT